MAVAETLVYDDRCDSDPLRTGRLGARPVTHVAFGTCVSLVAVLHVLLMCRLLQERYSWPAGAVGLMGVTAGGSRVLLVAHVP
jgi:hypothetical protein